MQEIEYSEDFLIIRQKPLILKLRSLGAGVEDEAETKITYLEAAYFADRKVLPLDKDELLKHTLKKDEMAREKYATIKYLRDRGYIVRPSLDGTPYLRLHRKGYRPGEDKTYYLIHVVKSDWKASNESLVEPLEAASRLRKELAIAIVDVTRAGDINFEPKFLKFGRLNFE